MNLFSSAKELMEPCHEKEHVKISITISCRKVGQTHVEWQACEQLENKRQCMAVRLLIGLYYLIYVFIIISTEFYIINHESIGSFYIIFIYLNCKVP